MVQFHFRLKPILDIAPWGTADDLYLHWFGLTDGWFWIEVGEHELFRYSQAALNYWKQQYPDASLSSLPYEDYQVVRYWEDLLRMLPNILDPLPADFAARVADIPGWQTWQDRADHWREASDDRAVWDLHYAAVAWWGHRSWHAGHLSHPPRIWLWRVEDAVHIRWNNTDVTIDGIPVWEARQGEVTLPLSAFLVAVASFHDRFLAEMELRVNAIAESWPRPEVKIDTAALLREQTDRLGWLAKAVTPMAREARRAFSWEVVRSAMASVERAQARDTTPARRAESA